MRQFSTEEGTRDALSVENAPGAVVCISTMELEVRHKTDWAASRYFLDVRASFVRSPGWRYPSISMVSFAGMFSSVVRVSCAGAPEGPSSLYAPETAGNDELVVVVVVVRWKIKRRKEFAVRWKAGSLCSRKERQDASARYHVRGKHRIGS
jgi:hypothetical protein